MEFIRENLHMNCMKGKTHTLITLDEEYIIPDNREGIVEKIKDMGEACLEKIRPAEDKIGIAGTLYFGILYKTEKGCQSYYGKIPFEDNLAIGGVSSGDIINGKTKIMDIKISVINSHKIRVRAAISVFLQAESIYDSNVIKEINNDSVQMKKREKNVLNLSVCKKENFRIRESVNLEKQMKNIGTIIWSEVSTDRLEITSKDGGLEICGNLMIFAIYQDETEGEDIFLTEKLPFSNRIDATGGTRDTIYDITILSTEKSLIARNDINGESRILDGELILTLDIHGYCQKKMDLLEDAYIPGYVLLPVKDDLNVENLVFQNNVRGKVSEYYKTTEEGKPLVTMGKIGDYEVSKCTDGINIDGIITVDLLYPSMSCKSYEIPFTKLIELEDFDDNCEVSITNGGVDAFCSVTANEIEINCQYEFDIFIKKHEIIQGIIDVTEEKENPEKLKSMPGIVGYLVKKEDTLWEIAKKYCTTVKNIMDINELPNETVEPGRRILVVKN